MDLQVHVVEGDKFRGSRFFFALPPRLPLLLAAGL
jgi:hypothetical protein